MEHDFWSVVGIVAILAAIGAIFYFWRAFKAKELHDPLNHRAEYMEREQPPQKQQPRK